jgi:AraC-like DNA-binding protein
MRNRAWGIREQPNLVSPMPNLAYPLDPTDFAESRSFVFTTQPYAPERRLEKWQETMTGVVRRAMSPLSEHPFNAEMTVHTFSPAANDARLPHGLSIVRGHVTQGGAARRTREFLADGNDNLVLHIQQAGPRTVQQLDRELTIGPGGGVLTSNGDVSTMLLPEPNRFASVALPRALLRTLAPGAEDMPVRPLAGSGNVLAVLLRYLDILDEPQVQAPTLRAAVATHISELCALAIGASRDAAHVAEGRGLRAARLRAVKADIAQHLCEPDLSPTAIARRQRCSPRYLHKLFEGEGTTLSRYVLGLRLVQVQRALLDPLRAGRPISALAYGAGFNDLSTFNREFRRRFGATPSDVRAARRAAA